MTQKRNRVSMILWGLYCLFLLLSLVLIIKICVLQFGWEPDQALVRYFQPKRYRQVEKPERGAIMDCNGKLLAISIPMYNINMDCTVRKDEFARAKTARRRDSLENDWKAKAKALAAISAGYALPSFSAALGEISATCSRSL